MERGRQVAAAIVGIFVIIVLIFLARWTGDRIKEKFLVPKPAVVTQIKPAPVETATNPQVAPVSTVSAIPATGPADFGYFLIGLMFLSGLSIKFLDRRV